MITEIESKMTMIQSTNESFSSFKTPVSGVNAIRQRSPNPKKSEIVINLFLKGLDLKIERSVLTESKKKSCKRLSA